MEWNVLNSEQTPLWCSSSAILLHHWGRNRTRNENSKLEAVASFRSARYPQGGVQNPGKRSVCACARRKSRAKASPQVNYPWSSLIQEGGTSQRLMLSLNMKTETSCSVFSYMCCYFYTAWTKYSFSLQLKQANTDWTLTKNQNSSIKRYGELNNLVQLHPGGIIIWLKLHSQGKSHDQGFWFAVIIPSTWTAPSCVRPCTRTPKTTWLPWPPASTGPGVLTWEAWKVRGQSVLCKITGLRAVMAHTRRLVHVPAVLMVQTSLHHVCAAPVCAAPNQRSEIKAALSVSHYRVQDVSLL